MDLRAAFERALALDENNEIDAAVACLDTVIDVLPDSPGTLKFAGQLYQRLGADRQSLRLLTRAAALAPDDAELHLSLGFHHVDNAALERALESFRRHLALRPDSYIGQIYLGRTLDWLGRVAEAETALECAVALDPAAVEPHLQLGRVRLRRGRLDAADQAFAAADALDPGNILAEIGHRRVCALTDPRPSSQGRSSAEVTVVCVKAGAKYGAQYVTRLAQMVRRNAARPPRFVCFTDDAHGLDGIETQPLPADGLHGWWNKVALFRETLPGVTGRVLYLDLDVVITGALDPLLAADGDFVVMDNDYVPGFNTSVMLFDVGAHANVWRDFTPDVAAGLGGDQDWVALTVPAAELWPAGWCVPFRLRAAVAPPPETKVVVFSGRPNPDEYPADWIRDYWR